jgi:hypothetical protein
MIYFAQPVDGGPIKIGCSQDVDARIRYLEFQYGRKLVVLGTLVGGRDKEKAIHKRFARLRLGRTEQFLPTLELSEFLGKPPAFIVGPGEQMATLLKPIAFQVRGSDEYKVVLEELAAFDGKSIASLADHAIRLYARSIGFVKPLPKR